MVLTLSCVYKFCGFCVIERLSCQTAGTNGPEKIESWKIYHLNIDTMKIKLLLLIVLMFKLES